MGSIDNVLIERVYSPVAGWVQHRLGVDQWRLSIECLNGTIAFHLAAVALAISRKGIADGIFADLLATMLWLTVMQFVRAVALRQAGSGMGRQTARLQEWLFRLLLVGLLPLSICYVRALDNFCHTMSLLLIISHLYFKTCDAPPPRRHGKRQLSYLRS